MIWATEYKHVELVKLLLSKGSDINIRDNVSLWLSLALSSPREADPGGGWRDQGAQRGQLQLLVLGSLTAALPSFMLSAAPVDPLWLPGVVLWVNQLLCVD